MSPETLDRRIAAALDRYWGFDTLRPLQRAAVEAVSARRDTLVVLPTGGGKSLCYQLPPLLRDPGEPALGIVVSPLIALMKDQVDGLRLEGYPAASLHSAIGATEAAAVRRSVESGALRLLLLSPERLFSEGTAAWLGRVADRVGSLAIDEAHCISQWGHDFRPEYRRLAELRLLLPGVPVLAATATATPRVREDIVAQLAMRDPAVLVGDFDRPNLTYRVMPRVGQGEEQVAEVLRRHAGAAAIVYCISRKQTEALVDALKKRGIKAEAYHAGLTPKRRSAVQEAFISERLGVVVATVAFGMGIDRGDVRVVVHASMPKSIEGYQQETGRAGRDGMPAECVLLYSPADRVKWAQIMERGPEEGGVPTPPEVLQAQKALLTQMQSFAGGSRCRHRALVEYFGQGWQHGPCGACDVCLSELEEVEDAATITKKILSCVIRLAGSRGDIYGAAYIADVLRGARLARITERGHDQLSTWGLLRDIERDQLITYIGQLVDQDALVRAEGPYPVLALTAHGLRVLKGLEPVRLCRMRSAEALQAADKGRRRTNIVGEEALALDDTAHALFESLRALRREVAQGLGVPPYLVFTDASLEEMARARPGAPDTLVKVRGIGDQKVERFGARFLAHITAWCAERGLPTDAAPGSRPASAKAASAPAKPVPADSPEPERAPTAARKKLFALYSRGLSIEAFASETGRSATTALQILVEYIEHERPAAVFAWVDRLTYGRVAAAADELGHDRLKPIFERLGGAVPYPQIRVVLAHLRGQRAPAPGSTAS